MGIDRELRFCVPCSRRNEYAIEDEYHFLLVCPLYNELREMYIKCRWNYTTPNEHIFATIMSDTRDSSVYNLARYLANAFELREATVQAVLL